jgi:hypothetical protein
MYVCHLPGCYLFNTLVACIVLYLSRKALTKRRDTGHRNITSSQSTNSIDSLTVSSLPPTLEDPSTKKTSLQGVFLNPPPPPKWLCLPMTRSPSFLNGFFLISFSLSPCTGESVYPAPPSSPLASSSCCKGL